MKTVVLSFKIVPAARPSARPPGPEPAEPIYIKLQIDRHGRLLLVMFTLQSFASEGVLAVLRKKGP